MSNPINSNQTGSGISIPKCILDLAGVASRPLRSDAIPATNDGSEVGIEAPIQYDLARWHGDIRAKALACPGQRTAVIALPPNAPALAVKLVGTLATQVMPQDIAPHPASYDQLSLKDLRAYADYLQSHYSRNELEYSLAMRRYLHYVFGMAGADRGAPLASVSPQLASLRQELAVFSVMLAMGLGEVYPLHGMTSLVPNSAVQNRLAGIANLAPGTRPAQLPLPNPLEILVNEVNHTNLNWLGQVPVKASGSSEFKFIVAKDPQAAARAPRGSFPYFAPGEEPFLRFAEIVQLRHACSSNGNSSDDSTIQSHLLRDYSYQGSVSAGMVALRRRNGPTLRAKGWAYANDIPLSSNNASHEEHEAKAQSDSTGFTGVGWDFESFSAELKVDKYVDVYKASTLLNSNSASATPQSVVSPLTLFSRKIRDQTSGKGVHAILALADVSPCLLPAPTLPLASNATHQVWKPLSADLPLSCSPLGFLEPILNRVAAHDSTSTHDPDFTNRCQTAAEKLHAYVSQHALWGCLAHVDRLLSTACMESEQLIPVLREQLRGVKCLELAESKAEVDDKGTPLNYRQPSALLPFSHHTEAAVTCSFETVVFGLRTLGQGGTLAVTFHEIISPMAISLIFMLSRVFEQITLQIPETGMPIGASHVIVTARHLREFRPDWALQILDRIEAKLRAASTSQSSTWSLASTWLIRPCEALHDKEFVRSLRMIGHSLIRQETYTLAQITRFALGRSYRRILQKIPKRPFGILVPDTNANAIEDGEDAWYDPITNKLSPEVQIGQEHVLLPFPPMKLERRQDMEGEAMAAFGIWVRLNKR